MEGEGQEQAGDRQIGSGPVGGGGGGYIASVGHPEATGAAIAVSLLVGRSCGQVGGKTGSSHWYRKVGGR